MNNATPTLLALALFFLSGCYVSPVPIAPSDAAPALPGLAGEWMQTNLVDDEAPMRLQIVPTSDTVFDVIATSTDPDETDVLRMRGYASLVGDHYFGNLELIDEDEGGFLLVRFERIGDDALRVYLVSDDLMTDPPATSPALYAFIEAHADNPALYEDDTVYFERID